MKFKSKTKTKCSCCEKDLNPNELIYIGFQEIDSNGNGFPLFNCECGSTISGDKMNKGEIK